MEQSLTARREPWGEALPGVKNWFGLREKQMGRPNRVDSSDQRCLDWRHKLGGLLECGWSQNLEAEREHPGKGVRIKKKGFQNRTPMFRGQGSTGP